jgi:hypothetical protein
MTQKYSPVRTLKRNQRSRLCKFSAGVLFTLSLALSLAAADAPTPPTTARSNPAPDTSSDTAPTAPLPPGLKLIFNGNDLVTVK